jgi:hypothetical protein
MDARAEALIVLSSWARLVCETRTARVAGADVGQIVDCLITNLHWLSKHDAAGDFAAELAAMCAILRRAADPPRSPRVGYVAIGACVEEGCTGNLMAVIERGSISGADISCSQDAGHRWPARSWWKLSRRLDRAA